MQFGETDDDEETAAEIADPPDGLQFRRSPSLAKFRYHTGATPTRLDPDEECPPLFRDVGDAAMLRFLQGDLKSLCGPLSPITYLRTADYREPYTDYGRVGRIMLLNPISQLPWHSGLDFVYIAPRDIEIDLSTMVFIPSDISLFEAAERFGSVRTFEDFRDAIGRNEYRDAVEETSSRLTYLKETRAQSEAMAAPLRSLFQSADQHKREQARQWMEKIRIGESDLCTAWHHLPDQRREYIQTQMRVLRGVGCNFE